DEKRREFMSSCDFHRFSPLFIFVASVFFLTLKMMIDTALFHDFVGRVARFFSYSAITRRSFRTVRSGNECLSRPVDCSFSLLDWICIYFTLFSRKSQSIRFGQYLL
ncbi:MAG: hypothetical protein IJT66_02495, partial [Clostridia bacterium]|nr:hypothetical protein [Clostridia bacterium]